MEIMSKEDPLYPKEENQRLCPTCVMSKGLLSDSNKKCRCQSIANRKRVVPQKIWGLGHFLECVQSERAG